MATPSYKPPGTSKARTPEELAERYRLQLVETARRCIAMRRQSVWADPLLGSPRLNAARECDVQAKFILTFNPGLPLAGDAAEKLTERLIQEAHTQLGDTLAYHVDNHLSRENIRGRILTALGRGPLSNAQNREISQMDRAQALAVMRQLRQ